MIAVDSSVVVAAFAPWHTAHALAEPALMPGVRVPAHALIETYSVLTRLPIAYRAPGSLVVEFFRNRIAGPPLVLSARQQFELIERAPELGLFGGMLYDALIGLTAQRAGATLVTLDERAVPVYDRMGVAHRLLS